MSVSDVGTPSGKVDMNELLERLTSVEQRVENQVGLDFDRLLVDLGGDGRYLFLGKVPRHVLDQPVFF